MIKRKIALFQIEVIVVSIIYHVYANDLRAFTRFGNFLVNESLVDGGKMDARRHQERKNVMSQPTKICVG